MGKEPWQIAAARFCVARENEFSKRELFKHLRSEGYDIDEFHLERFFEDEISHPPGRQHGRAWRKPKESEGYDDGRWTAPLEMVSTITDFDELRHARENATSAWKLAIVAIIVSAIAAIFEALQYFYSLN